MSVTTTETTLSHRALLAKSKWELADLVLQYADFNGKLNARVAELEAMTTPNPIEEAPKDQRVLVFCPEESDYGYTAAWVIGECVLDSWEGDSRLDDGVKPTHWLPLPPDPTQPGPTTESEL